MQKMFADIPATYELSNIVLTLGLDQLWRRTAARVAAQQGGKLIIDICCGTGDMTRLLRRQAGHDTFIVGCDFSLPMVRLAQKSLRGQRAAFVVADVDALPFRNETFSVATISFGLRNLNLDEKVLCRRFMEIGRRLAPAGVFVCAETSQPKNALLRLLFHFYVRLVVGQLGSLISGNRPAYKYLAWTIPRFYPLEKLREILCNAGFNKVSGKRLFPGIAATTVAAGFSNLGSLD